MLHCKHSQQQHSYQCSSHSVAIVADVLCTPLTPSLCALTTTMRSCSQGHDSAWTSLKRRIARKQRCSQSARRQQGISLVLLPHATHVVDEEGRTAWVTARASCNSSPSTAAVLKSCRSACSSTGIMLELIRVCSASNYAVFAPERSASGRSVQ